MSSLFDKFGSIGATFNILSNPDAKGSSIVGKVAGEGYGELLNSLLNLDFNDILEKLNPNKWGDFIAKLAVFTFFLLLYTYVGCSYIFLLHLSEDEFNGLFPIKPCQYDLRCTGAAKRTEPDGTVRLQGNCGDKKTSAGGGDKVSQLNTIKFDQRNCITACNDKPSKPAKPSSDNYCGREPYKFQDVTGFPYCLQNRLPKDDMKSGGDDKETYWFRIYEQDTETREKGGNDSKGDDSKGDDGQKGGSGGEDSSPSMYSKAKGKISGWGNSLRNMQKSAGNTIKNTAEDAGAKALQASWKGQESAKEFGEAARSALKIPQTQIGLFIKVSIDLINKLGSGLLWLLKFLFKLAVGWFKWSIITFNYPDKGEDENGDMCVDIQGPVDWYAHTMQASYINYRWVCRYFLELGGQARGMDKQFDILLMIWGIIVQKLFFVCSAFISIFVTLTMGFTWGWKGLENDNYWLMMGSIGWMFFPFLPGVGFALLIISMHFNIIYQFLVIWIGGTLVTPLILNGAFKELCDIFSCNLSYILIVYCFGIIYSGIDTLNILTQSVVNITVFICIALYLNGYFDIDKLKSLFTNKDSDQKD